MEALILLAKENVSRAKALQNSVITIGGSLVREPDVLIHALTLGMIVLLVGNHFIGSEELRWKTARNSFCLFIRLCDSWLYSAFQYLSAAREALKEPCGNAPCQQRA